MQYYVIGMEDITTSPEVVMQYHEEMGPYRARIGCEGRMNRRSKMTS